MSATKKGLLVLGSGGHAKVVIDIIESMKKFRIAGVVTKDALRDFQGYPVLGNDDSLPSLMNKGFSEAVIGVGGYTGNERRRAVFERALSLGLKVVTAIHPSAVVSKKASVGQGSVLFPGTVVNTEAAIGRNVIIATGATIDHETRVEDHALVSAGVSVGANVLIGEEALLAIGSTVISGRIIGRRALVAAGAVVVKDVAEGTKVFGVPAKP